VVEVALRDVPIGGELTASVRGLRDVEIRARVEGYLKSIDYREGSEVQKGQSSSPSTTRPTGKRSRGEGRVAGTAPALSKPTWAWAVTGRSRRSAPVSQAELDNAVSAQSAGARAGGRGAGQLGEGYSRPGLHARHRPHLQV